MEPRITINKLAAARRQLETAIQLHFTNADPVSARTLAGAAYGLVQDVNARRGGNTDMLKDLGQWLPKEVAKEFNTHKNRAENFLKHANNDPDAELTLDIRWTEVLLFDASRKFCELTGQYRPLMLLAMVWFWRCYPELLEGQYRAARETGIRPPSLDLTVFPKDRQTFFHEWLPIATLFTPPE